MGDAHRSRKFKELKVGDLFTFRGTLFTKIKPGHDDVGSFNAISDTTTGSRKKYFASNTTVEKLEE